MAKTSSKKKRSSSKGDDLKLKLLALCDSVSRDPNTKKLTLYGLFDEFFTPKFPDVLQPFALVVRLEGSGKHRISLKISDQNLNELGSAKNRPHLDVNLTQSSKTADAIFNLTRMPVTKAGYFTFTIHSGRKKLGTITTRVLTKNKKKKG